MWFRNSLGSLNHPANPRATRHSERAADRRRRDRRLLFEGLEQRHLMAFDVAGSYPVGDYPQAVVAAEEVRRSSESAARRLGRDLRMPGFRRGKVPAPVVIQRIGRDAVLDEAVRGQLGRWYLDAIDDAGIHPVGDPDLNLGDLPADGQPLTLVGVESSAETKSVW